MSESWLSFASLSDDYERRARFLPALLCLLMLMPVSAALGGPLGGWIKLLIGGVGLSAVIAVGLSHTASAMGNGLQKKLWPRWPHDSPTNRGLHPESELTSAQQRSLWYGAVKRLVGVDIETAVNSGTQVEATINDGVAALRHLFAKRPESKRLRRHNVDFGFARNFTGMRPIWFGFLVASAAGCWIAYRVVDPGALLWAIVASLFVVVLVPIGIWVLPNYVRVRANYYSESFFSTLTAVDAAMARPPKSM